jgi:hypothetical protein
MGRAALACAGVGLPRANFRDFAPRAAPPAEKVIQSLAQLQHAFELELAFLRVIEAAEQVRALAEPGRDSGVGED